jgi:hypothetical protein
MELRHHPAHPKTVAVIIAGFLSHQNDGGPRGVIFDQKLSEVGRYEIRVGQRHEKKSGKFELSIELK